MLVLSAKAGDQINAMHYMRFLQAQAMQNISIGHVRRRDAEILARGSVDETLLGLLYNAHWDRPELPGPMRAVALYYLKLNRTDEAKGQLVHAIIDYPYHAPYWIDLATVFAAQGRHEEAVGALVVAHDWAPNPAAQRASFEQEAVGAAIPEMGQVYRDAMLIVDNNMATLAQFDAAHPAAPVIAGAGDKNARFDFAGCDKPQFPQLAENERETGEVPLEFYADEAGRIIRARTLPSRRSADLRNAALLALAACPVIPAVAYGKPVGAWLKAKYVWKLPAFGGGSHPVQ